MRYEKFGGIIRKVLKFYENGLIDFKSYEKRHESNDINIKNSDMKVFIFKTFRGPRKALAARSLFLVGL